MTWIDLQNPCLNGKPQYYEPIKWQLGKMELLPEPEISVTRTVESVIESRRSRREFRSLTKMQLSTVLWLSCRTIEKGISDIGIPIERRPVASSGAIHPIHVLIGKHLLPWVRYNTEFHAIEALEGEMALSSSLYEEIDQVLAPGEASILLFVAEPNRI